MKITKDRDISHIFLVIVIISVKHMGRTFLASHVLQIKSSDQMQT